MVMATVTVTVTVTVTGMAKVMGRMARIKRRKNNDHGLV